MYVAFQSPRRSTRWLLCALVAVTGLVGACERKRDTQMPGSGNSPTAPTSKALTVFAAASLADAFREIGTAFESTHPGVKVEFSFAGSNQLRTQLENGAKGDVFASADRRQMDAAVASSVVDRSSVAVFALNRLAVILPRANPAGIETFHDLARPGLKIVVADKAVPVGNYTRLMLEKAEPAFAAAFKANVVSREENVAAVVAKVALGEADAGVAYASDAVGRSADKLKSLVVPAHLEQRAEYLIAVTAHPADSALAREFLAAVASPSGATTLIKHGYAAPGEAPSAGKP